MGQHVRDIMTQKGLSAIPSKDSVAKAAKLMLDEDIGDVLIEEDGQLCGIVTDRDIVVRAIARGLNPADTSVGQVCSKELTTLSPTDEVDNAVAIMRKKAIRRIPVVENGKPIGVVSLGDLAVERDPKSVLAGMSAAPPNN